MFKQLRCGETLTLMHRSAPAFHSSVLTKIDQIDSSLEVGPKPPATAQGNLCQIISFVLSALESVPVPVGVISYSIIEGAALF